MKTIHKEQIEVIKKALETGTDAEKRLAVSAVVDMLEIVSVGMKDMVDASAELSKTADDAIKRANDLSKTVIDLTTTIKSIHIVLNSNRETLAPDLLELSDKLADFVVSSAAIKIGVINNANATK